jgi:hypothetical protein
MLHSRALTGHRQAADAVLVGPAAEGAEGGVAGVRLGLVLLISRSGGAGGRGNQYAHGSLLQGG